MLYYDRALREAQAHYETAKAELEAALHTLSEVGLSSCGQREETRGAVNLIEFLKKRAEQRRKEATSG